MIRFLRFLLVAALALALVTVALANRDPVSLRLLSDDLAAFAGRNWSAQVPLFLVFLAGAAGGLLVGFVWEWAREHKHRATGRSRAREIARLERELAELRGTKGGPQDDVLALIDRRKAG